MANREREGRALTYGINMIKFIEKSGFTTIRLKGKGNDNSVKLIQRKDASLFHAHVINSAWWIGTIAVANQQFTAALKLECDIH